MRRMEEESREPIYALQHEIRNAGERLDRGWRKGGLVAVLLVLCGTPVAVIAWTGMIVGDALFPIANPTLAVVAVASSVAALGGMAAIVTAGLFQRSQRAGAKRRLVQLAPEQRRQALLPLDADCSPHTREIIRPLLRQFVARGEVSPAVPPEGRGDEPAI